jgi:hypothetical protein
MGLDMWVEAHPHDEQEVVEIASWRKHNRLHGWMHALHISKGHDPDEFNFNLVPVPLSIENILDLEHDVRADKLPATGGFFFGEDSYGDFRPEYDKLDKEFIKDAKAYLKKGWKIFYNSSW